jgi:hypothetical protein
MELRAIFEFECMPGSNSCSAAFSRGDSLGPPLFHASSTLAKAWNCYAFAKADPGFLQQSEVNWLRCYRDTRRRDDMPRELNPINQLMK